MKRLVRRLVGMAVLVAGCSSSAPAPAPAPAAPGAQPYANLAQVMRGIPFPNSNIIFDTQSLDPDALKDKKPGDAAAWARRRSTTASTADGRRSRTRLSRFRRPRT